MKHFFIALGCTAWGAACGGIAIVDDEGGGNTGGTGASGTGASGTGASGTGASGTGASGTGASGTGASGTGASGTGAAGGGPAFCTTHEDCLGGTVCIFSTGTCSPTCGGDLCDDCGPGAICDGCASSSCPACADCLAACVSISPGECDDSDPCPDGQHCDFETSMCWTLCSPNGACPPDSSCDFCGTSSGCGDDDCVAICFPFDIDGA